MGFLHDHKFVHRCVTELQEHLATHEERGGIRTPERHFEPHELKAIREGLEEGKQADPPKANVPYLARNPLISLVQSAMYEHAVSKQGGEGVERTDVRMGAAFTPGDIVGWGVDIGLSLISRFLHGKHDFEDHPAVAELDDANARLVLFADWGTGMADGAGKVIDQARPYIDEPGLEVHVIHLGDTYYSGTPLEARKHVLDLWPVSQEQSAHIGSWALNGNHDMYSGGHGYFETTLGEDRFRRQRADGKATSWFHLRGRQRWDVIGLDTAYRDPIVAFRKGDLFAFGRLGFLHGSQAGYVNDCSADPDRRVLLLSHHQLFSAYDDDISKDSELRDRLKPTLDRNDVDAWFWGHEHDCLAYEPFRGVKAARVIGHGAVPTPVRTDPAGDPYDNSPELVKPTVPADKPQDHPMRAIKWEYRAFDEGDDGQRWARHGFAVVDMSADGLRARYVDEYGHVYMDETI